MSKPKPKDPFHGKSPFILEEESDRRPLSVPDGPISIPRDWAGHICVALAVCLNSSRDGMDLGAVEQIGRRLLELHPDLVDEVPYVKVLLGNFARDGDNRA